jgi:RNA 2',3'-cyclic 3'-phosphodiesterase
MTDLPINLFLATLPPPREGAQIDALGDVIIPARGFRGRRIARERLHSTLAPIHAPRLALRQSIARAKAAAAQVRAPAFPVRFEWTQSFRHAGDRYPFVLSGSDGLAPLRTFQACVADQLRRADFVVPSSFTPHVTLIWAERCVEEAPIAPLEWTVRDFALIASLQGQSRHIHLASWSLD